MAKRIVSYSLFGSSPLYLDGALRNARLVPRIYEGWIARIYASQEIPDTLVGQFERAGAEVIRQHRLGPFDGTFWRFLPTAEEGIDAVVVRDVDSRPTPREFAAVSEWIASGKTLHIMRDHPFHRVPIMAGMWGCRGQAIQDMPTLIERWKLWAHKGQDQDFLRDAIYPRFRDDCLVHSDLYQYRGELCRPFPSPRARGEFVGAVIDGDRDTLTDVQTEEHEALFTSLTLRQLPRVQTRSKWVLTTKQWFRSLRRRVA
jgi:hypothetical protein